MMGGGFVREQVTGLFAAPFYCAHLPCSVVQAPASTRVRRQATRVFGVAVRLSIEESLHSSLPYQTHVVYYRANKVPE